MRSVAAGGSAVLLLFGVLGGGACQADSRSRPGPGQALRDSLGLPASGTLHRITLSGRGAMEHVVPSRLEVDRGDLVEFLNVDRRIHRIVFLSADLTPDTRRFLETTGQMESPPLLNGGSRFVVTFQEAPPGEYSFVSRGAGGDEEGMIVVR